MLHSGEERLIFVTGGRLPCRNFWRISLCVRFDTCVCVFIHLIVVYFTTLSVALNILRGMMGKLMNNEFLCIWKEAIVS